MDTSVKPATNRRTFLRQGGLGLTLGLPFLSFVAKAQEKTSDPELLDEESSAAKSLAYVHDGQKAKRIKRFGVEAQNQTCKNCKLYQADSETGELGRCSLIKEKKVASQGWCSRWMKA